MAQITARGARQIHLDLTPMVDLGFLLITFFLLSTQLSKPKTLELLMPSEQATDAPSVVAESCSFTITLHAQGFTYYEGSDSTKQVAALSLTALRKAISDKQARVRTITGDADKLVVRIKPLDTSIYQSLVDVLDEMLICKVGIYAII